VGAVGTPPAAPARRTTVDIAKLTDTQRIRREEAARRLHEIADELASGNGFVLEKDGLRFDVAVPDEVVMKVEVEIESDEREIEIELSW
jgi:amphi-Trp domain-containing protein